MATNVRMGRVYEAACLGKEAFESARLAHEVQRRKRHGTRREAYRCEFCGKWHLGGGGRTVSVNLAKLRAKQARQRARMESDDD